MNKIEAFKKADAVIGKLLVSILSQPRVRTSDISIKRVLCIRPGGIGDAVLLIPVIQSIKKSLPKTTIVILAEKRNAAVFQLCPEIDDVLRYDRPTELFSAFRGSYDLVIDTEQWHRMSAVVARLINAPMSIGFATNERKKLFTHPVDYSHDDYEVLSFLNLLKPLMSDVPDQIEVPFLTIPPAASVTAHKLLDPIAQRGFVALFPGGSIIERQWGSGRFHEVAMHLNKQGFGIAVVGGKEDIRVGEEIVSSLSGTLNLCGKLTLPETAAVLQQSSLLVTGDSGIMHIGYGLGIKIVALFGPGREKKWATRGKNCIVINKHLPCSPCTTFGYTPKCKINAPCMSAISIAEVFEASMSLLGSSKLTTVAF